MASVSPHRSRDARLRPTEHGWDAVKDRIGELYVYEQRTAAQVMEIMKAEYGFHATLRMYKARFDKWGFAHKNTKGLEYEAMKMIYDQILGTEDVEVQFSSPRGKSRQNYSISDVRKELARPGSRKRKEMNLKIIAERGTEQVLQRKGITYHRRPLMAATASTNSCSMSLESDSDQEAATGSECATVTENSVQSSQGVPSPPQHNEQPSNGIKEADLDMGAFFEIMGIEQDPEWYVGSRHDIRPCAMSRQVSPVEEPAPDDPKVWVSHVFQMCIQPNFAGEHRNRARHTFTRMLDSACPHILSSLIHVSCVLSAIGAEESYRSILRDCCELIDQQHSRTQTFATPYRYALACEEGHRNVAIELGRQLLHGTERNESEAQELSSNFLVCQQFRAHHLLEHMKDAEGALIILQRCLEESQQVLVRDHSINVNCLNVLARAYEGLGHNEEAIIMYQEAAERSQSVFGPRNPYRLTMLRNIAVLQATTGRHSDAEQNLWEVYRGRTHLLGPGHRYTHSSLQLLQNCLIQQSRRIEATRLEEDNLAEYRNDKHWKVLPEKEAELIRRQGRSHGMWWHYWERPHGLSKYEFVMPREAYMRQVTQVDNRIASSAL